MLIRPAIPADAPHLALLRWEFRSTLGQATETRESFLQRATTWMTEAICQGHWRAWVVESETGIEGGVWLLSVPKVPNPVEEPEQHAIISSLYLRPSARGTGLGEGLLAAAVQAARQQEVDSVLLWPTPGSRSLYHRHGFVAPQDILALTVGGHNLEGRA